MPDTTRNEDSGCPDAGDTGRHPQSPCLEDTGKPSLVGMDRGELAEALAAAGVPGHRVRMRVRQLWRWLYVRGVGDFAAMGNIARDLRAALADRYTIARPEVVEERVSRDGTRKWLLRFAPRGTDRPVEVETVHIPEAGRGTLCLSSQAGCTLTCPFCRTGTQRFVRNLTAQEILSQVLVARDRLSDFPCAGSPPGAVSSGEGRKVSNIVMMGMGEPLHNFDNVKKALLIASDNEGLSLSKRRITLSTSGIVPLMSRLGAELGVMLAVSLHAVNDELRDKLVPINRKYPLRQLMQACRDYPGLSNSRRITFEYVMLRDVNDSPADARTLVSLLEGIPAKINLIPFNRWPGSRYACSHRSRIQRFAEIVNRAGYASPVRAPRGRDILAACGQLRSATEREARETARRVPGMARSEMQAKTDIIP